MKISLLGNVEWEKDEDVTSCSVCNQKFSFTFRRHHCRACGKIFCYKDCNRFFLLPSYFGFVDPVRCCNSCWRQYSGLDFTRTYDEYGPEDANTILLIHGALTNRNTFIFQIESLSKYYRCITLDLPGHGSRINDILNRETAVEAIHDAITNLSPNRKVLLFGYSLGGYVAMLFAKRYPELLSGVIYGGCLNEISNRTGAFFFGAMGVVYNILPESLLWKLVPQTFPHVPRSDLDIALLRTGLTYQSWNECKDLMIEPIEGFFCDCIREFKGKSVFLVGEKDQKQSAQKFVESAENGSLVIIKGATHLVLIEPEHRDEVNLVILEVANSLDWS